MALSMWVRFLGSVSAGTREGFLALLRSSDIDPATPSGPVEAFGAAVFEHAGTAVLGDLRACATGSSVLAICISPTRPSLPELWAISRAAPAMSWCGRDFRQAPIRWSRAWSAGPPSMILPTIRR